ncbi:MAG: hypothetical protein KDE27_12995 [Planctomycetes bacterium]|nr:hypothetical protein [Planctomycetota bacterium]
MTERRDDILAGIPSASDLFELIKTLEFDHPTAGPGGEPVSIRIRLFRSVTDPHLFRCRLSRLESWRLSPTFPDGPAGRRSDEEVEAGWDHTLAGDYGAFRADGERQALAMVCEDLARLLRAGPAGSS